jgi:hypothetical protein
MSMMKTQYNPNRRMTSLVTQYATREQSNFYIQLTLDEKLAFNQKKLEVLSAKKTVHLSEMSLNKFKRDRNYQDLKLASSSLLNHLIEEIDTEISDIRKQQTPLVRIKFHLDDNAESECA